MGPRINATHNPDSVCIYCLFRVMLTGSFSPVARKVLNLIVTCSARKTVQPSSWTRARTLKAQTLPERFDEWTGKLERCGAQKIAAQNLYCGSSWAAIRRAIANWEQPEEIKLWIISAGHGLVSGTSPIAPYAATFCSRHADFVLGRERECGGIGMWWRHLVRWRRSINSDRPTSIEAVAKAYRNSPLLVALSADYFSALMTDLSAARRQLRNPSHLVIICAGAEKESELKQNLLPCDSRLEHILGRGRSALNARILGRILSDTLFKSIDSTQLGKTYSSLLLRCPPSTYPKRTRQSDEIISQFISARFKDDSQATHSWLLTEYRRTGFACEQSRFRDLFKRVQSHFK